MSDNNDLLLGIGVGKKNRGRVKNVNWTWKHLSERLSVADVGRESLQEYRSLPKEQQLALKNANGFFVGGVCKDGVRKKEHVESRCVVCLDFDDMPESLFDQLLAGESGLGSYEHLIHTSRKHERPDSIRCRIVVPLSEPITPEQYEPVARMVASWADPEMRYVDGVSFRVAQYMFFPTQCRDGVFEVQRIHGDLLNPESILDGAYIDWSDTMEWPRGEAEEVRGNTNAATRREDPRQKLNTPMVAAFCRTYDIHQAIATFLPDHYVPAAGYNGERYTYTGGTSAEGARVYDDGLYLHSEHESDPANGQNNAFDLVRLHLFGERDNHINLNEQSVSSWPSFKAMAELVENDPEIKKNLREVKKEAVNQRICEYFDDEGDESDSSYDLAASLYDDLGCGAGDSEEDYKEALEGLPKPEKENPTERFQNKLEECETLKDLRQVIKAIQGISIQEFPTFYRESLIDTYTRKAKEVSDGKFTPTRAEARKQMKPSEEANREALREQGTPEWLQGFCFLTGEDKFLNFHTGEKMTERGFNGRFDAICARLYATEETGLPTVRPSDAATVIFDIPKPYIEQYWPQRSNIYTENGIQYANSYRDTGAQPDGNTDRRGVELLKVHLENLFPEKADRDRLLDFLAHLAQKPDQKLRYALLMKGVRGDGKTFFDEMMKKVLGETNCTNVSNSAITSRFNSYVGNSVWVCIEEAYQPGKEAHELLNNMKPDITNDYVAVEQKGKDVKTVRNFSNFFLTTNYADALPLEDEENRYLVLFTRFHTTKQRQEWEEEWREKHGFDFYKELYRELEERPYQFREFLENYRFSEHYAPWARAPRTRHQEHMAEDAKSSEHALIESVIEQASEPLCGEEIFCWWRFQQILDEEMPRHRIKGRGISSLMRSAGFMRAGKYQFRSSDGQVFKDSWIWTKNPELAGEKPGRIGNDVRELVENALEEWRKTEINVGNVVQFPTGDNRAAKYFEDEGN